MSIESRLSALEAHVAKVTVEPYLFFIDDSEALEIIAYSICTLGDAVEVARLPGESIKDLQERCRVENLRIRKECNDHRDLTPIGAEYDIHARRTP
jgi:hypothetical protein